MKTFIFRVLLFILSLTIFIGFGIGMLFSYINKRADFKIGDAKKYIILGHSHPQTAFNDSLIPQFLNLAESGESYFYTYFKAKKVLEQNAQIKTVFIEFSNNQMSSNKNEWIWGDVFLTYRYPSFSPFMGWADQKLLFLNNSSGFLKAVTMATQKNINRLWKRDLNYKEKIGGYNYLKLAKVDSLLKHLPIPIKLSKNKAPLSIENLNYLDKLIDFCKSKGVRVFLIRSPVHTLYPGLNNELAFKKRLAEKYPTTEFLDFAKFPLNNEEFADLEHLNYKGANVFSNWFNAIIEDGLLLHQEKQKFINKGISELMIK
jgi:hypothetical protein